MRSGESEGGANCVDATTINNGSAQGSCGAVVVLLWCRFATHLKSMLPVVIHREALSRALACNKVRSSSTGGAKGVCVLGGRVFHGGALRSAAAVTLPSCTYSANTCPITITHTRTHHLPVPQSTAAPSS